MRRLVLAALLLSHVTVTTFACADSDDAPRLFTEGTRLLGQQKYPEACAKFEASQRLDSTVGTALYLGACYEVLSKWASAVAQFKLAEQLAIARGDDRQAVARRRAGRLAPKVSQATIHLTVEDAAVRVALDNVDVPRATWASVALDPGPHTFVASAPGKKPWSLAVNTPTTALASTITVPPLAADPAAAASSDAPAPPSAVKRAPHDATATTPAPPPARDATSQPGPSGRRIAGLAVGGAGVVAIGVGSYLGLHAKSLFDDSGAHCRADDHCDATGGQLRTDAKSAALTSTILFGFGGALIVTGVVLYVTGASASAPTSITLTPSGGPSQARLDLRGTF
jgi:hypothetical protein